MEFGYHLSSEEHAASDLVAFARRAEEAGFDFLTVSDHFHPWLSAQGHSPNVWVTLGAVAAATERITVGTGVTCPIMRQHPALVAHAAATVATMLPGRFFLGVGTGELLNEHVLGQHWPTAGTRLDMLAEAIDVIRELWTGKLTTHHGRHFTVENARIFDVPGDTVPIYVAAAGEKATRVAGEKGDGLISLSASEGRLEEFHSLAGADKPALAQIHVCVAPSTDEALETVRQWWANTGVPGALNSELPLPEHYEAAAETVSDDRLAAKVVLGDDPDDHLGRIEEFRQAGYDRVWVHQIGPHQERLFDLYTSEVLPRLHATTSVSA